MAAKRRRRGGVNRRSSIPVHQWLRLTRGRHWAVSVAVVLLLALVSWLDHAGVLAAGGDDLTRYDGRRFVVVRVIDGDTLDIDAPDGEHATTRVRLWGIDTPELARNDQPAEPFANQAAQIARRLAQGQMVELTLEPARLRGRYGRLLAFVTLPDGKMLNEALLVAGLAQADDRWAHRHQERFELLQMQARRDRKGLWGDN